MMVTYFLYFSLNFNSRHSNGIYIRRCERESFIISLILGMQHVQNRRYKINSTLNFHKENFIIKASFILRTYLNCCYFPTVGLYSETMVLAQTQIYHILFKCCQGVQQKYKANVGPKRSSFNQKM